MSIRFCYYNHVILPYSEPHENVFLQEKEVKQIWKVYPKALLIRYTNGYNTTNKKDWYYVVKDEPFDINNIKSKRRYVIKQGVKYFEVKSISVQDYQEQLYEVAKQSFSAYPKKYRPKMPPISEFIESLESYNGIVYGAFFRENNLLCGYSIVTKRSRCISFPVQKTMPNYEKFQINAALVKAILDDNSKLLAAGFYVCDGSRSVYHETNFQDYLEKYFGFRKIYCDLNLIYNPKYAFLFRLIFAFKSIFAIFDGFSYIHQLNAIIKMQELSSNHE